MWTRGNAARAGKRLWTTRVLGRWVCVLAMLVSAASGVLLVNAARGQSASAPAPALDLPKLSPTQTIPQATQLTAPPGPEQTLAAFGIVEQWVGAWQVPSSERLRDALPRTTAACVTLRRDGRLLSRGEAIAPQTSGLDAGSTDLVRLAAERAIKAATPRLNVPNDALRDQAILEAAKRVTISLELAGPFVAVEPATWGDVDAELAPGLDGVNVRVAGSNTDGAIVFPSTMLAAGMIPSAGMKACVSEVVGEGGAAVALEEPKKLKAERKLEFRRFKVTHVQHVGRINAPTVLYRGSSLNSASVMTRSELVTLGRELTKNLLARASLQDDKPNPVVGELSTRFAAAALSWFREVDRPQDPAAAAAISSLVKFVRYDPAVPLDAEPGVYAAGWLARILPEEQPKARALDFRFARAVEAAFNPELLTEDPQLNHPQWRVLVKQLTFSENPESVRSLIALAIARNQILSQDSRWREPVTKAMQSLYTDETKLLTHLPWLGWTDEWLSQSDPNRELLGALALRRMRTQLWQHQLTLSDAGPDNLDMVGGIVFTSGLAQGKGNPYPTWQCVRPLAFVATMLRDKRLTEPQERSAEIVRLMLAARFLRQLQVDESNAWMYSDPQQALGAIRASVWDKSTPIDATSLTLMFVTELIKSLDALAEEKR
jgi:hypothetical protein